MDEEMQYFRIAGWDTLQHYKDRNPPWIKLHNSLLDDYQFSRLTDPQRFHLLAIMMLASRTENYLPDDAGWLKTKLGASTKVNILPLIDSGFLEYTHNNHEVSLSDSALEQDASTLLDQRQRQRRDREETEKSRGEQINVVFDHWIAVMNKPRARLTKERKAKVIARLKDYSIDDLKQAIDGCARSPHHMGQNDTGTIYDDLELICRDGKHVEQFRDNIGKAIPQDVNSKNYQATRDFANE